MQISEQTIEKYQREAPELVASVMPEHGGMVMKRDCATDYCVNYDQGLCRVHRQYGDTFLGDACHFFPRSTKQLGGITLMSAALSCPEVVRLAVVQPHEGEYYHTIPTPRLPHHLRNYLPEGMQEEAALHVHQACVDAAFSGVPTERALMRLHVLAGALPMQPLADWADVTPMYLKLADGRIPSADPHIADAFNLFNILATLVRLSNHPVNARLQHTLDDISSALGATIDAEGGTLQLCEDSAMRWQQMVLKWQEHHPQYQPILARWLAAQLALGLFPFAGLGSTAEERLVIIAVRFATIRLAVMSYHAVHDVQPSEAEMTRIFQSIARFMDHISDPTTSLILYAQMGWMQPARLHGLLAMHP